MKKKLNKTIIARNFSSAANIYDQHSDVQKIAAQNLCQIALPFIKKNHKIIDLGCGTSNLSKNLGDREVFELDLSLEMLKQNNCQKSICADIENLPLCDASFDMIISSFSLQWVNDFEKSCHEFNRILKKDGILAICLPVAESICELKEMSSRYKCNFNFNEFAEIQTIEHALNRSGFIRRNLENKTIKTNHKNALTALKSIKDIGAKYCDDSNFIKKSAFKIFKNNNDSFDLSWEVLYLVFQKN